MPRNARATEGETHTKTQSPSLWSKTNAASRWSRALASFLRTWTSVQARAWVGGHSYPLHFTCSLSFHRFIAQTIEAATRRQSAWRRIENRDNTSRVNELRAEVTHHPEQKQHSIENGKYLSIMTQSSERWSSWLKRTKGVKTYPGRIKTKQRNKLTKQKTKSKQNPSKKQETQQPRTQQIKNKNTLWVSK